MTEEEFIKQETFLKSRQESHIQTHLPPSRTKGYIAPLTTIRSHSLVEQSLITPSGKSPLKKIFKFPLPSGKTKFMII